MQIFSKNVFLLPFLIACFGLMPMGRVTAQTFSNLHSFAYASDGGYPTAELVVSGNTLFGTAAAGGSSGNGTVFRVNTDGTGFINMHNFLHGNGSFPAAGLFLSGNTLYGTTFTGGTLPGGGFGRGTVFRINTNGLNFTNLHTLAAVQGPNSTNADGANPEAGARLVLSGNTLYGTAQLGGSSGSGALFAVNINGTGFTNLHNFTPFTNTITTNVTYFTNIIITTNTTYTTNSHPTGDGANPWAGLILSGGTLYGATAGGGFFGNGTIFKLNTVGTGFTNLYSFTTSSGLINTDGLAPHGTLILLGNTLYGTARYGGTSGNGTLFRINTNGTGFTNLHNFAGSPGGANPYGGLISSGNSLFGTTYAGGTANNGTVFKINIDGTGFTILHSFKALSGDINSGGANPFAPLIISGNTLYGTAGNGGTAGYGVIFSLALARPELKLTRSGTNVVLTWRTDVGGFTLQFTTNLSSSIWTNISPGPFLVNGQNTVTNPISDARKFYRLIW